MRPVTATKAQTAYNLSTPEAAAYLDIHPDTLKRWVKAGLCEATKTPKGYYRFRREDLDRAVGEERAS